MNKINYNIKSATNYGWTPEWFGATDFNRELLEKIKAFQSEHNLTADGLCGPSTYRRIFNTVEDNISDFKPSGLSKIKPTIVAKGKHYSIAWPKVVLWDEPNGLELETGFERRTNKRKVTTFVNHWDVCLSSKMCHRVLQKRGISVQFCIDNDGTIYQLMDMNHVAWHAGSRAWNRMSIGVEISNAYYIKHRYWYIKNGFGSRNVINDASVHGKTLEPHLDFYPIQIEALKALWAAVYNIYHIPLKCPVDSNGKTLETVTNNQLEGFISHYHLTRRKTDCAGLDLAKLLEEII